MKSWWRILWLSFGLWLAGAAAANVVVFWEGGFPTAESQPVSRAVLTRALEPHNPVFAGVKQLQQGGILAKADLLVLPYGSAFPVNAWPQVHEFLRSGGSLLTLGGRPLHIAVDGEAGSFRPRRGDHTYSRLIGVWHTYEAPQKDFQGFVWDEDYAFLNARQLKARRVFVAGLGRGGGNYRGMGYMVNSEGRRVAAAVTRQDHVEASSAFWGARHVFLNFDPQPGFWESSDGVGLIGEAAAYALDGATQLWVEVHNAALGAGETPQAVVHLRSGRGQRRGQALTGSVRLELLRGTEAVAAQELAGEGDVLAANAAFTGGLEPGLYVLRATWPASGRVREVYHTGFWVRDPKLLASGSTLQVKGDYFALGNQLLLPYGTNYFSTDVYHTGFFTGGSLAGNAYRWERDFAQMKQQNVTFVRTGIWLNHEFYLDRVTGSASERLLRALEGFLLSAGQHGLQVQFTFFAFDPQTVQRFPGQTSFKRGPGTNPYTDPVSIRAQRNYVQSIVARFKDVPYVSWDLINEPSFSNPGRLWRGNTPNDDPTELAAWNRWLEKRYASVDALAGAWRVPPQSLSAFGRIPLPAADDLTLTREGNDKLARAVDYNLFAQDAFNQWAAALIQAIRSAGGKQPVTVGQDEGGVTNRLLNHFYADSGVDFTSNHTWWRDDALLWGSVAAKRPGIPNLIGETGVQPAWGLDLSWRWDEINALGLFERKMALGFAAANSGSLHWDWALGDTFGIKRRDGSDKYWMEPFARMGEFALKAAPYAQAAAPAEVAIVLPQSLQLSVFNNYALEAQQTSVRVLYQYARSWGYAVGEYQLRLLGKPKLIILPSPWVLHRQAWETLLEAVRGGATLLTSGRLDADEHFFPTGRLLDIGLPCMPGLLATRENLVRWPGGSARLTYGGDKTTYLERGVLPGGETFREVQLGQGRILYFSIPLELNSNLDAVGSIYRYALERAGVRPVYATETADPGMLIAPTVWNQATLYVLTSESSGSDPVVFQDLASGRKVSVPLAAGRAAMVLIRRDGEVVAAYNDRPEKP